MKEVFSDGGLKFVSALVGDSQISLIWCPRHLVAAVELAVSCSQLYFARRCDLKQTGTFSSESKVMCFFLIFTDFHS